MLKQKKVEYRYRDYREQPLSQAELKRTLKQLGLGPRDVLRRNDKAFRTPGLTGDETDARLIALMAEHPTLRHSESWVASPRACYTRCSTTRGSQIDGDAPAGDLRNGHETPPLPAFGR